MPKENPYASSPQQIAYLQASLKVVARNTIKEGFTYQPHTVSERMLLLPTISCIRNRLTSLFKIGLLLILFSVLQCTGFVPSLHAQIVEDTTEVIGFDDILDEPLPEAAPGLSGWLSMVHLSGRFDINYEIENPANSRSGQTQRLRNYHKFLFLKVTPTDRITLDAEVLDLTYYEIAYELTSRFSLRAGRIWVPFGATPFHHYYGGVQGDPFNGLFLPNVWSEFGVSASGTLLNSGLFTLEGDLYSIRGFDSDLGNVISFTAGGSDDIFAAGARTRLGIGTKISLWGSVLYNQFGPDNEGQLLLWGGDLLLDYGLLDLPFLRDLRLRAAFARAEVQDELLVDPDNNADSWYFRYGDYAEISYRGLRFVIPRVRYGTIIDFDDIVSPSDSHNWEVALMTRLQQHMLLLAQYQFNQEEVNEIDNDLFRFGIIFEF